MSKPFNIKNCACCDFGLTITLKKTNVLGQDVDTPPVIAINITNWKWFTSLPIWDPSSQRTCPLTPN